MLKVGFILGLPGYWSLQQRPRRRAYSRVCEILLKHSRAGEHTLAGSFTDLPVLTRLWLLRRAVIDATPKVVATRRKPLVDFVATAGAAPDGMDCDRRHGDRRRRDDLPLVSVTPQLLRPHAFLGADKEERRRSE
jgi:hypothetical protein